MSNEELNSLDDYERFVSNTIRPWSQQQRIALAVSMAERWLPVYQSFSEEEQWGDPTTLQRAVQSVWNCLLGYKITPKDRRLHRERLNENAPHMDDFDASEALATIAMIDYALDCCLSTDNNDDAVMAMVSGFEGVADGIYTSPDDAPPDVWQLPQVQDELEKQLKLLKLIGDMVQIDEQHIEALRQKLVSPDLVGSVAPRPEPLRGLTNEAIFEQYRRGLELNLKGKWQWENDLQALGNNTGAIISVYVAEWMGRYLRRKEAIEQGPMIDVVAHHALLAMYSTHDAAVQGDPEWDQETRFWIELCYQNPHNRLDVNSPEKPHRYGPSMRGLWVGRKANDSDKDPWTSLLQWGRHRPTAWEEEDKRKKKGLAYSTPELGERLTRKLRWHATDDVDHPWATDVAGETWRVRLNDFPDELMYSLLINDAVIGNFHDWPECWQR